MDETQISTYSRPAILSRDGRLTAISPGARLLLPECEIGEDLPGVLQLPEGEGAWEGSVAIQGRRYRLSAERQGEQWRFLLEQEEQRALTEGQLDASLYQVRRFLHEFLQEIGPCIRSEEQALDLNRRERFSKSYYQMLRLVDHLDFLRDAAGENPPRGNQQDTDLAQLCFALALESDGVLREMKVRVDYEGPRSGVFVQGDGELLRTAVLELVSNAARRCKDGGAVYLKLSVRANRALLVVYDNGPAATRSQKILLTNRGLQTRVPTPDQGAGLGLSVAQTIVQNHGGALLADVSGEIPKVLLSIPVKRGKESITFRTPLPERNAGMSQVLIALSDVLPGRLILPDWEE